MNYIPIHTSIAPNYNYLSAENAFLKQDIEYKNSVICEQQATIEKLRSDVEQLSQSNMAIKQEMQSIENNANRWSVMKKIIKFQGSERQAYEVEKIIDKDLAHERKVYDKNRIY
jgi:hypothetical protein